MMELHCWEDPYKRADGYDYCYCTVDTSDSDGNLYSMGRGWTMESAKKQMLENLKVVRDEIDDLIKRETETK